jgi:methionyl-tRNA synthetase
LTSFLYFHIIIYYKLIRRITFDNLIITIALPYSNGNIHLGHLLEGVQADIWNRYKILSGCNTIFVSGNDAHGSAISIKAKQENISEEELIYRIQKEHHRDYKKFQVDFDHFGTTHTEINKNNISKFFKNNKHLFKEKEIKQLFDEEKNQFLSDRYVIGECPNCNSKEQYGDGCEICGKQYSANELINPISKLSNTKPILKNTTQIFYDTNFFREQILDWLNNTDIQESVRNKLKEWLNQPLKEWDISREAPYFGFKIPDYDKFFYVWIDAPIGYISIVEEYLKKNNIKNNIWDKKSEFSLHQFIGKDIINYHGIYWISELLGFDYILPKSITTHGFLTIDNEKISKSKGNYLEAKDFDLPPESLRYYYASKLTNSIEDLNLDTDEIKEVFNNKLVGGFINLGSRIIKILEKNFDSKIGAELDFDFIDSFKEQYDNILNNYENRNFREVVSQIENIIHQTNSYVNKKEPWKLIKDNKEDALIICNSVLNIFFKLSILLEPIIPEVSKNIYSLFNKDNISFENLNKDIIDLKLNKYQHLLKRI